MSQINQSYGYDTWFDSLSTCDSRSNRFDVKFGPCCCFRRAAITDIFPVLYNWPGIIILAEMTIIIELANYGQKQWRQLLIIRPLALGLVSIGPVFSSGTVWQTI